MAAAPRSGGARDEPRGTGSLRWRPAAASSPIWPAASRPTRCLVRRHCGLVGRDAAGSGSGAYRLRGCPRPGSLGPAPPRARRRAGPAAFGRRPPLANARLIWTVPQAEFDAPSEAARLIEAAERSDPSPGPFRIHRMLSWYPAQFATTGTAERLREWIDWERGDTSATLCLADWDSNTATILGSWNSMTTCLFRSPSDARTRRDGTDLGRPGGPAGGLLPEAKLRPLGGALLPPARRARLGEPRAAASPRSWTRPS